MAPRANFNFDQYWDGLIDIPMESWMYTLEELELTTPSRNDPNPKKRVPFTDEIIKRIKGVYFIFNSCRYLKLSRSVAITASTYFHRFYMKHNILSYHYYEVGTTCIFIACKTEECRRKLSDVIKVCARIATGNREIIDEESKIYWQWKDLIVKLEETMLQTFQFDVSLTNPYVLTSEVLGVQLDPALPSLNSDPEWDKQARVLCANSINYLEVLVRLPLVLLFPVEVICAMLLLYSSHKLQIEVKKEIYNSKLKVNQDGIIKCLNTIIKLGSIANKTDRQLHVLSFLPPLDPKDIIHLMSR